MAWKGTDLHGPALQRVQGWAVTRDHQPAPLSMRSPIPGLGRVMVFLAAALASASLAVPEAWGEEAPACHHEDSGLLHAVSLRLGYLPGVPFVSCRASDYENFSCSWTSSVETFLPTRYITTYRTTLQPGAVKPDPPEGLVVEPIPLAPRRLHVSWKYPSSWPKEPHFQLRFRLQYRPIIHRSWSVVETVNLSEVITDAFAGLEHVVQVSAKDFLDAGNWSEWSAEARATPVRDPATMASEETTTNASLESLAEEPSQAPNPEPINRSDPLEKMAILVSLGIFAFFILAAVLVITILIW
ncbi:PREDICTED: interleukin-11 receptor subunit alpha [Pygoscelis adeliae]|uniref:interleukin-11 receptor subunit alpha n=1 Tax=Pygoscelis adeliae TaxID=9238 RepID=UPI0004F50582|nr:PREDICTED: interleukin-11 receptor subunit alpha [Pygoscelis adeliae]